MADIRRLSLQELESLTIFPSGYSTTAYLRVVTTGTGPEKTWSLKREDRRRPVRRRLDGATLESLIRLYGPADELSFIGAVERDKLAGLITWKFESWNHMVWLHDIRVRDSHQRAGIGTRLLEELKWDAIRLNASGIMLETQNTNHPALDFYLAKGFELVGINTHLYGRSAGPEPEVALYFHLSLDHG